MSLTRRRLFQRLVTPDANQLNPEVVSDRGREARVGFAEQATPAGAKVVRISSNENPLGPGQHVLDALVGKFPEAGRYPFNATQHEGTLPAAIAAKFPGAKAENVVMGAGSGEILTNAVRAFTSAAKPLATPWPSFENPTDTARKIGTPVRQVKLTDRLQIDIEKTIDASKGAGLVFFCNPNNPTATVHGKATVADFVKRVRAASPDTIILIDEAYHDYVTDPNYSSAVDLALSTPNVFVTRTFSKAFGMAGLRIGYAIGHAPTIRRLNDFKLPYGIGTPHIAAMLAGLNNPAHIEQERKRNTDVKAFTLKAFADLGFTATDSQSNFIFVNLKRPAAPFRDACAAAGVLVGRDFPPYEKTHCRFSIGTMAEMQWAVDVFRKVLGTTTTTASKERRR
ncbi:MAG: histidinol-phosphate transaminase [Acidobacteriota bacterium]|nr:histidinol-phosphate transaminase [Acidobacteriota bacterium]